MIHPRLTPRQSAVLRAIEHTPDWSIPSAAVRLGISTDGVIYHVRQARSRCRHCANLGQLIAYHIIRHPPRHIPRSLRPPTHCVVTPGQMALPAA